MHALPLPPSRHDRSTAELKVFLLNHKLNADTSPFLGVRQIPTSIYSDAGHRDHHERFGISIAPTGVNSIAENDRHVIAAV
jgi:hypothetical protein